MKFRGTILMLLLVLFRNTDVWSQTCCTGGVPITGAFRINNYPANSAQIRFTYDYNRIEDVFLDGEKTDDQHIKRATQTALLQVDYVFSETFALSTLIPYVWTSEKVNQLGQPLTLQTNGLGDIAVVGQFKIPVSDEYPLIVGGGVKLPSGATQKVGGDDGFVLPANLQPGTGSFDALLLLNYQTSFSERKSLIFTSSVYYRINTTSKDLTFHDNYKFGNELQVFAGFSDNFVTGGLTSTPSLLFRFRSTAKDQIEDFSNDNTGGIWLYFVPGLNLNLSSNVILGVSADLPILRDLNGYQITTSNKLTATLQINIGNNEKEIKKIDTPF